MEELLFNCFFLIQNIKRTCSKPKQVVLCEKDVLRFPKRQTFDSSKPKGFADDNFEFDDNDRKFSKLVENTGGKRRNCSLRAISPFPTLFSKDLYCRYVKTRACLGKG